MNLTANFSVEELIASETADRNGIDNVPPPELRPNLRRLALKLEEVRSLLAGLKDRVVPIHINSGYRSPALNASIAGSSKTSAHQFCRAADIIAPGFGVPYDLARAIRDAGIVFDQLIYEHTWVHIGIAEEDDVPRQQCLTLNPAGGYVAGILLRAGL